MVVIGVGGLVRVLLVGAVTTGFLIVVVMEVLGVVVAVKVRVVVWVSVVGFIG